MRSPLFRHSLSVDSGLEEVKLQTRTTHVAAFSGSSADAGSIPAASILDPRTFVLGSFCFLNHKSHDNDEGLLHRTGEVSRASLSARRRGFSATKEPHHCHSGAPADSPLSAHERGCARALRRASRRTETLQTRIRVASSGNPVSRSCSSQILLLTNCGSVEFTISLRFLRQSASACAFDRR